MIDWSTIYRAVIKNWESTEFKIQTKSVKSGKKLLLLCRNEGSFIFFAAEVMKSEKRSNAVHV